MWNKELVELLLAKYQQHDNLYNVRNPAYLDRAKRLNSLFDIWQELKKINNGITIEAIKKKIHSLRAQYIKESHEIAKSIKSGTRDIYVPTLWCFPQLEFLKSHCTPRKLASSMTGKRTTKLDRQLDNVKNLIVKRLQDESVYNWLGEQVVFQINLIKSKKIQRDTAWKIQAVLREASVGESASNDWQSHQLSSEIQPAAKISVSNYLWKSEPTYSEYTDETTCQFQNVPVCPVRLISTKTYDISTLILPSPVICNNS